MRRARAVQVIDDPNGDWRKGNGRKPEAEKVREWREEHPESNNKSLCARETRLDRKTVAKWWNGEANVVQKPIGKPTGMGAAVNEESPKLVFLSDLFAPGSKYTIPGYTHEELLEIITTGRWQDLGLDPVFS